MLQFSLKYQFNHPVKQQKFIVGGIYAPPKKLIILKLELFNSNESHIKATNNY